MNKRSAFIVIFILMLLIIPMNVFAEAEVYDVVLFFGQSNMTGFAGSRDGEKVMDARVNSIGIDSFSQKTGINKDILSKYTKMNHVDADIPSGSAYEYVYESNSLRELSSGTEVLGENLKWDPNTNKFITVNRQTYYATQESYGTNMIPQFVSTYYKTTGRKVIVVMAAHGGQEIAHFLPHDQLLTYSKNSDDGYKNQYIYEAMELKYNAAISYLTAHPEQYKIGKKFYVIFQGEADVSYAANGIIDTNDYYSVYEKVHNQLVSKLGIEYGGIVESAARPGVADLTAVNKIHTAQVNLINNHNNIFLASAYPYNHFVPAQGQYQGTDYENAIANSKLSMCIVGTDENNSIHFNSAALSQVGYESAQNAIKYLTNNNNWLSSLSVDGKPMILNNNNIYDIDVDENIDSIDISATKLHNGLSFIDGFGPRKVQLDGEKTTAYLKVKNGNEERVYTFKINKVKNSDAKSDGDQVVIGDNTGINQPISIIIMSLILIVIGIVMCIKADKFLLK